MGVIIMAGKNYLDLKAEIWDTGKCAACGACVAVCPADAIYFEIGRDSTHPLNSGYCKDVNDGVPCGACYEVCPRIDKPSSEILGEYIDIVSAQAGIDVPRKQSGGAVTAILTNALEQGMIDAIVTVVEDPWTLRPSSAVITSSEVLVHHAGSRYNWWVPLVASLKEAVITRKYTNIAVVGVPCVMQAVSKMRKSEMDLLRPFRKYIRLAVGLFCTETFDYEKLVQDKLIAERQIDPLDIMHFDVKGKLEITLKDGNMTIISLKEVEDCVRPGCHICTDLTALDADISAGSIGSSQGYTTLIIRNPVGKQFVDNAVRNGKLSLENDVNLELVEKLSSKKLERMPEE
ncbi:Coenzyme F420 hydrogenase/dehydrogenase, beta subunit C-terminal domain [uncultured Methanolobus sp.]|uniref:Coenzyme F420 hydrogenase/dehydrogenase, beta subunit C-terminal domain n=1 Tax=uncultured Methanolobus sp. TaxID=218300 RepID=UPI003748CA6F